MSGRRCTPKEDLVTIDSKLAGEIQTALKAAGCYHGAIDGDYGPVTKAALKNYCLTEKR